LGASSEWSVEIGFGRRGYKEVVSFDFTIIDTMFVQASVVEEHVVAALV
jgi:hypothetical protein